MSGESRVFGSHVCSGVMCVRESCLFGGEDRGKHPESLVSLYENAVPRPPAWDADPHSHDIMYLKTTDPLIGKQVVPDDSQGFRKQKHPVFHWK